MSDFDDLNDLFRPTMFLGDKQSFLEDALSGAPPRPLFSREDFQAVLSARTADMIREIQGYAPNELLNTGTERLLDYFQTKYRIDFPELDEQDSSIRHSEVNYEARDSSSGQPEVLVGTSYQISLPFHGDPRVFNSQPASSGTLPVPLARLEASALTFTYDQLRHDAEALAASYNRDIASVRQHLNLLADEAHEFNMAIRARASGAIKDRRSKLLKDQGVAASLGIRLVRANRPLTYTAPEVQRKPRIVRPGSSSRPYVPEPALEMAEYEHILTIIRATSLVIERNPTTFSDSTEPQIRDHFLVQLNGHYGGEATGETFNAEGKADILIRSQNKNIFIAEVKFWDGKKSVTDALIQLLTRYATWRDSKLALIVLNRRRDFSKVLAQIPSAIEASDKVLKRLEIVQETDFRYLLRHPDDADKELVLTVMCFEVPRRNSNPAPPGR